MKPLSLVNGTPIASTSLQVGVQPLSEALEVDRKSKIHEPSAGIAARSKARLPIEPSLRLYLGTLGTHTQSEYNSIARFHPLYKDGVDMLCTMRSNPWA